MTPSSPGLEHPLGKREDSHFCFQAESIWEEGGETGRALLPTCPLLPGTRRTTGRTGLLLRRAPRARRRRGQRTAAGPRGGWSFDWRSHGEGEKRLRPEPRSWSTTHPQDLGLLAGLWERPAAWSWKPAAGAAGRERVRGPDSPGLHCACRRNGAAAPSAAPDGSPVAKYRLSTPVLASSAP